MDLDLRPLALPAAPCGEKTLLIAGPCAAETEAQVMQTARELADSGVRIFRAGIWDDHGYGSGNANAHRSST